MISLFNKQFFVIINIILQQYLNLIKHSSTLCKRSFNCKSVIDLLVYLSRDKANNGSCQYVLSAYY